MAKWKRYKNLILEIHVNATVTPSRESHVKRFSRNWLESGYFVVVTEQTWQLRDVDVTGRTWHLPHKRHVDPVTAPCTTLSCHKYPDFPFVALTGQLYDHIFIPKLETWQLRDVNVTERTWQLSNKRHVDPVTATYTTLLSQVSRLSFRGFSRTALRPHLHPEIGNVAIKGCGCYGAYLTTFQQAPRIPRNSPIHHVIVTRYPRPTSFCEKFPCVAQTGQFYVKMCAWLNTTCR